MSKAKISSQQGSIQKGLDVWLETRLHEIFDSVMAEDIPQDLLDLVRKMDEKQPTESVSEKKSEQKK